MMTYEDAIQCLQVMKGRESMEGLTSEFPEHFNWENIKAIDLAIKALDKQISKKPRIESEKEIPITHRLGRLLKFHCPSCGKFIVAIYETDVNRGGGISQRVKGCSTCLQAIDFAGYYHIGKLDDDIEWGEDKE